MPEITDEELKRLQTAQGLLDGLLKSPKTKRGTERLIKALHPDTVISDDFEEPIHNEVKAIGDKLDKFLTEQAEKNQDGELNRAFDKLRTDAGFTDEGIEKLKKIMVDTKTADPFVAAAYYDKMNPPPTPQTPSSFSGTSWNIGGKTDDPDLKLLFEDEDAWAEKEARAVLSGK